MGVAAVDLDDGATAVTALVKMVMTATNSALLVNGVFVFSGGLR